MATTRRAARTSTEKITLDTLAFGPAVDVGDHIYTVASSSMFSRDCPKCGTPDALYRHSAKTARYRDVPSPRAGMPVVIEMSVMRFRCRECGQTSLQDLPQMDGRHRMTLRCAAFIRERAADLGNNAVARLLGIDEKTVRNVTKTPATP